MPTNLTKLLAKCLAITRDRNKTSTTHQETIWPLGAYANNPPKSPINPAGHYTRAQQILNNAQRTTQSSYSYDKNNVLVISQSCVDDVLVFF